MQFIKKNVPVAKGMQPSRYDTWLAEFVEPGDALYFSETELSRQTASNAAKRLMLLDSKGEGRKFHSFYDVIEKMVVIRVRPAGEVPSKEEEKEETESAPEKEEGEHVEEQIEANFNLD